MRNIKNYLPYFYSNFHIPKATIQVAFLNVVRNETSYKNKELIWLTKNI